ncbi:YhcN/YlaJ family sporulation lipoprotein [Bacillus oleivorans]|nr:YhcN/YlaJ family sporulation lipoprotein [Bacillus oleivorans]
MFKFLSIAILLVSLLVGCGVNQEDQAMDNRDNNGFRNVGYRQGNDVNNLGNRNQNNNNNLTGNNENGMEVADQIADQVTQLDEVRTANVIVTDRNAYVAVVLNDDAEGEVTDRIKNRIADQVRKADRDIQNVYVSSNPDFVDRMADYGDRIGRGEPIEGLFDEFNETIRRVFPAES